MRHLFNVVVVSLLAALAALPAAAQTDDKTGAKAEAKSGKPALPAGLQPLPEPPPPPPGVDAGADEPQVTIVKRGTDKVEEYRVNGKLYMLKVTPRFGAPYYLMDDKGDGTWLRQESTDFGVRVPHWVVGTF